tara:strand:- start:115 stop:501 length:387 start_codon:yes stop_codon:yes gene_type:complete
MFKFIRNLFANKNKEEFNPDLSTITIEVNNDGTLNIVCYWPDYDETNADQINGAAKFYALAIHALNSGLLEYDMIDTLKNFDQSNPYNSLFSHCTLVELINLEKIKKAKNTNLTKPVISPLDVFKSEN